MSSFPISAPGSPMSRHVVCHSFWDNPPWRARRLLKSCLALEGEHERGLSSIIADACLQAQLRVWARARWPSGAINAG